MQEKWVYDKQTFDSFAKHWETNKPVPKDMFDRIKAMRTYRKGTHLLYTYRGCCSLSVAQIS
jgi:Zn-dependent oligopeptidase